MNRAEVLDKAKAAVADREGKYGHPMENFERIARRWTTHMANTGRIGCRPLTADDVAAMLIDVKLARAESGVHHPDNFIDVAGYAALAAEIGVPVTQEQPSARMLKGVNTRATGCTCGARIAKDLHKPDCPVDENRRALRDEFAEIDSDVYAGLGSGCGGLAK
jgi:hypothetical protein